MKIRAKKKGPKGLLKISKSSEIPATQGQLDAVRGELKSDITSLGLRLDGVRSELKSDIASLGLRLDSFHSELKSDIASVLSAVHHVTAIVEEQNARNKLVIDGYKVVIDIQEDLRARTKRLERKVFGIDEA